MAVDQQTMDELVSAVHRYTRERLVPLEDKVADEDHVPDEVVQEFRDMGLFGLTTPEAYGGMGLNAAQEAEILVELTWAMPAFRSMLGINLGIGSQSILNDATQAQRDEWLPRIASGEVITSFCLTEPHSGSDAAALLTSAVRDGDDYIINGSKRFITNGPVAGVFIVMARTTPERLPKNAHVTAFLVPGDTPGIIRGKKDRKMGQAGSLSCDITFEDVRVPASSILGGVEGRGFATAMKSLDRGRISVSAACVGTARRALYEATRYAHDRTQFGQRIGDFQLVQALLADSHTELYAAECMLRDVARKYDSGARVSLEASCSKMYCSEMVGRVADRAVQIHGGAGYMRDSVVERIYRDARVFRIYEGTTQIQQTIIGKELMKRIDA